jgi:hypothetical protein
MIQVTKFQRTAWRDFNLFLYGDVHEGASVMHYDGWEQLVDTLKSPYEGLPATRNRAIEHGDILEGVTIDHPFYDEYTHTKKPLETIEDAIKRRIPIRKHLDFILEGNHDLRLKHHGNVAKAVTDRLNKAKGKATNIIYGSYSTKATWNDRNGNLMFKSYHTHGRKGISSVADDPLRVQSNMMLSLKRHLMHKFADTILMCKGHTHKLLIKPPQPQLYLYDTSMDTPLT